MTIGLRSGSGAAFITLRVPFRPRSNRPYDRPRIPPIGIFGAAHPSGRIASRLASGQVESRPLRPICLLWKALHESRWKCAIQAISLTGFGHDMDVAKGLADSMAIMDRGR